MSFGIPIHKNAYIHLFINMYAHMYARMNMYTYNAYTDTNLHSYASIILWLITYRSHLQIARDPIPGVPRAPRSRLPFSMWARWRSSGLPVGDPKIRESATAAIRVNLFTCARALCFFISVFVTIYFILNLLFRIYIWIYIYIKILKLYIYISKHIHFYLPLYLCLHLLLLLRVAVVRSALATVATAAAVVAAAPAAATAVCSAATTAAAAAPAVLVVAPAETEPRVVRLPPCLALRLSEGTSLLGGFPDVTSPSPAAQLARKMLRASLQPRLRNDVANVCNDFRTRPLCCVEFAHTIENFAA